MAEMIARSAAKPEVKINQSAHQVISSPDFKKLAVRRWTVSSTLLIPYAPEFMKAKIGEVTTTAIPMGIGVIVFAFILTAIYVVWANSKYDPEVDRLKAQLRK